jgi:hypothetical protein
MNNKQKGSAFERLVCRKLSVWVSGDERRGDLFWRSAMSGGRATLARKRGETSRIAGDIAAVSPEGHALTDFFYVECKHLKSLDLTALVCTGRGALALHWHACCASADYQSKKPMLIAKQNMQPTLLCTRMNEFALFADEYDRVIIIPALDLDIRTLDGITENVAYYRVLPKTVQQPDPMKGEMRTIIAPRGKGKVTFEETP